MYVVSRKYNGFPQEPAEIEQYLWYNAWRYLQWPYNASQVGQRVYLFNNVRNQHRLYIANFKEVYRNIVENSNLAILLNQLGHERFVDDRYYNQVININTGYLLAYKFEDVEFIQNTNHYPNLTNLGWLDLRVEPIWGQIIIENQ